MLPKLLIVMVVVVLGFLGLGFVSMKFGINPPFGIPKPQPPSFSDQGQYQYDQDYFADIANFPSCGDKKEFFTVSPLKLTDFKGIVPLGLLAPTAHVLPTHHLFFHPRRIDPNNFASLPAEVPAFAPGDITITEIKYTSSAQNPDLNDGVIVFAPCKEVKAYLDHFKTFSSTLQKAFDEGEVIRCDEYQRSYKKFGTVTWKLCSKKVNLQVKAGEQLGTAGGGEGQMVFDLGVHDKRVSPATFANLKSWKGQEQKQYTVCPLDYYTTQLQEQLKARLGNPEGSQQRTVEPVCGTANWDLPKTAQGVWIFKGEEGVGHENPHLALAYDNIDPTIGVISMGLSGERKAFPWGAYNFQPKDSGSVNRHFKDIKADGQVYCFETEDTYHSNARTAIILQMPTSTSLKIEKLNQNSCGLGGWKLTNYVEFER